MMVWPFKRKAKKSNVTVTISGPQFDRKAMDLYSRKYPALDRHFELQEKLSNTYTPSSEKAVEKGIQICREMIAISEQAKSAWIEQEENQAKARQLMGEKAGRKHPLPRHMGFQQLAIIMEKSGNFEEAIKISRQARAQGWNGDWDKRIARCEAKIAKRKINE
jgi:hypothetical protein